MDECYVIMPLLSMITQQKDIRLPTFAGSLIKYNLNFIADPA